MALMNNLNKLSKIYIGEDEVKAVYLGRNMLFPTCCQPIGRPEYDLVDDEDIPSEFLENIVQDTTSEEEEDENQIEPMQHQYIIDSMELTEGQIETLNQLADILFDSDEESDD